jgi:hypothetical protein
MAALLSLLYVLQSDFVQQAVPEHHSETKCRCESDDKEDEELPQCARVDKDDNGRQHQDDADNGYEPFNESTGLILLFHTFVL